MAKKLTVTFVHPLRGIKQVVCVALLGFLFGWWALLLGLILVVEFDLERKERWN